VWCDELILIFAEIINEVKIKKEKKKKKCFARKKSRASYRTFLASASRALRY
jgi:CO/xanthine dehydrogenase FAD-binding subunit